VTLQLLWEEYIERHGEAAYRRSAFCQGYRRWEQRLKRSMRQRHFAGEKLFVDYAGRIFFGSARVATHVRSYQRGAHTTIPDHMPKSHRAHAQWSPRRLIQWGESIGPGAGTVVEHLLRSKPHPEQGYRTCLGLLALARQYSEPRLEAACRLAMHLGSPSRKSVKSILESGRDLRSTSATEPLALEPPAHRNVRGPGYYH
jgi:transposase